MIMVEPPVKALESALGRRLQLVWTDNRTVYLSVRPAGAGRCVLRLHRAFQGAPERVWRSIQTFLGTGRKASLLPARAHFESWRAGAPSPSRAPRRQGTRPAGRVHHLGTLVEPLLALPHLENLPPVALSWGVRRAPGQRCIRLGSYRAAGTRGPALIRVNPALDGPAVPVLAVTYVLHHELVHHCLMTRLGPAEGRRHGREFLCLEALFPRRAEAVAWERDRLPELFFQRSRGPSCAKTS